VDHEPSEIAPSGVALKQSPRQPRAGVVAATMSTKPLDLRTISRHFDQTAAKGDASRRSVTSFKLEQRLRAEQVRQAKLRRELDRQEKLVSVLSTSLARQAVSPQRRPAARPLEHLPSKQTGRLTDRRTGLAAAEDDAAAVGPVDFTTKALAALDNWLRLRNYRAIDLFRMCDINVSGVDSGDDLLDLHEFEHLLTKKLDLRMTRHQVKSILTFLDRDENGSVDVQELDSALKRARRLTTEKDNMHTIAEQMKLNPYSQLINLPPLQAARLAKRGKS